MCFGLAMIPTNLSNKQVLIYDANTYHKNISQRATLLGQAQKKSSFKLKTFLQQVQQYVLKYIH